MRQSLVFFTDDNVLKLANENYPEQVQQSKESRWDQYFIEEQQTL
jgi:sulfur relay (sulfurtransferase) DsrF/TusC family protein